jgi:hypothetical protein
MVGSDVVFETMQSLSSRYVFQKSARFGLELQKSRLVWNYGPVTTDNDATLTSVNFVKQ